MNSNLNSHMNLNIRGLIILPFCLATIYTCRGLERILKTTGDDARFKFLAWSSIAQSVYQQAFSLLAIWCLGPRVQILHSAEEHNLSPFDSNIACLCQSIEINNKYVYRQSQVRKSTDSGVKWAECSLIIGTCCRVQFLTWSSIAQSVFQRENSVCCRRFGVGDPGFKSCIQQRNTTCLLSIWISLACARASKLTTNMYVCMYIYIYIYGSRLQW